MSVDQIHLDIESFSEIDIKECGAYRYAEDESTFIWCIGFKFNNEPKCFWMLGTEWPEDLRARIRDHLAKQGGAVYHGKQMPTILTAAIRDGAKLVAHNAGFERTMLNGHCGREIGWPKTPISQWRCTASKSRAHGLPGGLGDVASALGTHPKNEGGRAVMLQVCRPKKASKKDPSTMYTPASAPEKFWDLFLYNMDDVEAEYGVDVIVPDLTPREQAAWELSELINDRGVATDPAYIGDAQFVIQEYRTELEALCLEKTGLKPTQRDKIAEWIRANGYPGLTDMQAETVGRLTSDEAAHVPDNVKTVLKIYSTYGMKAVSKFESMKAAACSDGRVRGMFVFYGAGTGRWSSVLIQLQNLARPIIDDMAVAIEIIKLRCLAWLRAMYGGLHDPMKVIASTTRGALTAAEEKELASVDFAGIESRVTSWMAGEGWKLRAFEKQDREGGPDNYQIAIADILGIDPATVDKRLRQKGKPIDLFGGYEGGVNAFVTMAKAYHVKLEELVESVWQRIPEEVMLQAEALYEKMGKNMTDLPKRIWVGLDSIKRMWRRKHPATVRLWRDMKDAAVNAVLNPGSVYSIPNKKIMFKVQDRWLYMRLPSGRKLAYFQPRIEYDNMPCPDCAWLPCPAADCKTAFICETCEGEERVRNPKRPPCDTCGNTGKVRDEYSARVTYMGIDTKTRQWTRVSSYGGKWVENAVQAASRDLLVNSMFAVEARGWPIVMTVHDEIVLEVPAGTVKLSDVEEVMCELPAWAEGLPLAAEGWVGVRYRK